MSLKIRVITPDKIVWNTPAEEVVLPSTTGQLGILNDHAPLITALEIGVLRVKLEDNWKPIILLGGFAEVENNEVTILVNGIEEVNEGEMIIVPKGVNHKPYAKNEAEIMIVEPRGVINTGKVNDDLTAPNDQWI